MNEKMVKKKYEPMMLRRIEFEIEDVLAGSNGNGFFGEGDDFAKSINSDYTTEMQKRTNPTR
ncbi:MAG: hypothetical protein IKT50_00315 [Clostridia bacterium]|nr:hypothetical protein [Clostridia bacterium]